MKEKLSTKQMEINKLGKDVLKSLNQYKKDKENGLNPCEYFTIDNKLLDHLFGQEKINAN